MNVCKLCLFPRRDPGAACPICGLDATFAVDGEIPADFALRMAYDSRLDVAWASLEEKVAREQGDARDCTHLAWLSFAFKDYRAVEVWCHESERLDAASPEPHIVLATVLERGERWQEAIDEYDAALRCATAIDPGRREYLESRRDYCLTQIPEW